MTSLRRDLVHVGDLMRNSIGRLQDITPATPLSLAPSTLLSSGDATDARQSATGNTAGSITTSAPPTRLSSIEPDALEHASPVASYHTAVADCSAPLQAYDLPSPAAPHQELELREPTGTASFAESPDGGTKLVRPGRTNAPRQKPQQQQEKEEGPIRPNDIECEGLTSDGLAGALSTRVAEALKQPVPAGAYVVRDVKISRLAGELEPVLM